MISVHLSSLKAKKIKKYIYKYISIKHKVNAIVHKVKKIYKEEKVSFLNIDNVHSGEYNISD